MEIRDYLRAIRRILPLLIILPIIAAAITGFLLEKQPSKYEAKATVVVPAISGNGTSQSAASQYVDTFKDVLISQPVIADVSQKFNIPTAELVDWPERRHHHSIEQHHQCHAHRRARSESLRRRSRGDRRVHGLDRAAATASGAERGEQCADAAAER